MAIAVFYYVVYKQGGEGLGGSGVPRSLSQSSNNIHRLALQSARVTSS